MLETWMQENVGLFNAVNFQNSEDKSAPYQGFKYQSGTNSVTY